VKAAVKTVAKAVAGVSGYFWTRMRLKSMKAGILRGTGVVPGNLRVFSLGRRVMIPDNDSHKTTACGQKRPPPD
jgi:hypothetical protein